MTTRTARIAPSILAADFMHLADEVRACENAGLDVLHCDVMDGHFVPNLTFGPPLIRQLRQITKLELDVHLMIEQPERSVEAYRQAGADVITVHQEVSPHLHRTLQQIRALGAKAGVSLNPSTPIELLEPVLGNFDYLLIMTVNPGFGGQRFIETMLPKIEHAQRWRRERGVDFTLAVDGGIDAQTAPRVVAAGADHLVAGTAVFAGDLAANVRTLREAARC
jgi:ribulose-phosphate 3-epimerase